MHRVLSTVKVWTGRVMDLPSAIDRGVNCWTKHKVGFGRCKTNLILHNFYNVCPVVEYKSRETSKLLLNGALYKLVINNLFLFVTPHHILAVICMLENAFDQVLAKVVWLEVCNRALAVASSVLKGVQGSIFPDLKNGCWENFWNVMIDLQVPSAASCDG